MIFFISSSLRSYTEKFDQAIGDYQSGLDLKVKLLPTSSRQIAEAHYKLSMVLDLTSGRLADAIGHVESALGSVRARLSGLRAGLDSAPATVPPPAEEKADAKGKGKQIARLVRDSDVKGMSKSQIEKEISECEGLKNDLALKVSAVVPIVDFGISNLTFCIDRGNESHTRRRGARKRT